MVPVDTLIILIGHFVLLISRVTVAVWPEFAIVHIDVDFRYNISVTVKN